MPATWILDPGENRPNLVPMATIEPYRDAHHRSQVIDLWTAVFGYDGAHNAPGLSIDRKLAVDDGLFFVALAHDRVIGTVLAGYDGHRGWLYSVAVHPAHRHQGHGRSLVLHAEQALVGLGCLKINLQVMPGNGTVVGFYEALGYQVEPRVSMGRRIPENLPARPADRG